MTLIRLFLFVFVSIYSVFSVASQDDTRVLLRRPLFLFSGNEEGKTNFLSAYASRANFGAYIYGDEFHDWRFGTGFEGALLSFGKDSVWRAGANVDGLADGQNKDFFFHLGQAHFEVFSAYEFRIDESVIYLGYRHRCRHAFDKSDSRIVMKSGSEIGFNGLFHLGPVDLISSTALLVYLVGQNFDISHQHRLNLSSVVQVEHDPWEKIGVFASVGLAVIWVTESSFREYYFFTSPINNELRFSPSASAGLTLKGSKGDFKVYFAYNSNLDAGFRSYAQKTHLAGMNGEFWF